jgi:hypothetical protein
MVPVAIWTGMDCAVGYLLTTGALTTTKVSVAPVSTTSMLSVGVGVDGGEGAARSADAIVLMKLLVSIVCFAGVPPCHLSGL